MARAMSMGLGGPDPLLVSAEQGLFFAVRSIACAAGVRGVNFSPTNEHGQTPLHLACGNGHSEVVKVLLGVPGRRLSGARPRSDTRRW